MPLVDHVAFDGSNVVKLGTITPQANVELTNFLAYKIRNEKML